MNWYKKAKLEDIPDTVQKMFGLGKYRPETKYQECPKCGKKTAYYREIHPDTDAGMDEIVLYCKNCGELENS